MTEVGKTTLLKVFFLTLGTVLFALSFSAKAQQGQLPHIGFLDEGSISLRAHLWDTFRQRLRELGYQEGHNIAFLSRGADGKLERLEELAAELIRVKVSIIVTGGIRAAIAAQKATTRIPIVMASGTDPVGVGLIASLSRPGGNVTGVTTVSAELAGKRLELLQQVVPRLSRVAVLRDPPVGAVELALKETQVAAETLSVQLQMLNVRGPKDFDSAFLAM
jgi:putative ABC transport system substrate-binding protein